MKELQFEKAFRESAKEQGITIRVSRKTKRFRVKKGRHQAEFSVVEVYNYLWLKKEDSSFQDSYMGQTSKEITSAIEQTAIRYTVERAKEEKKQGVLSLSHGFHEETKEAIGFSCLANHLQKEQYQHYQTFDLASLHGVSMLRFYTKQEEERRIEAVNRILAFFKTLGETDKTFAYRGEYSTTFPFVGSNTYIQFYYMGVMGRIEMMFDEKGDKIRIAFSKEDKPVISMEDPAEVARNVEETFAAFHNRTRLKNVINPPKYHFVKKMKEMDCTKEEAEEVFRMLKQKINPAEIEEQVASGGDMFLYYKKSVGYRTVKVIQLLDYWLVINPHEEANKFSVLDDWEQAVERVKAIAMAYVEKDIDEEMRDVQENRKSRYY